MNFDGSTSGEPYFWQTPDSDYFREYHREDAPRVDCECCGKRVGEGRLEYHVGFAGNVCAGCIEEWFLMETWGRRNLNLGGEWTK